MRTSPGAAVAAAKPKQLPEQLRHHRPANRNGAGDENPEPDPSKLTQKNGIPPVIQSVLATLLGCAIIIAILWIYGWATGYFNKLKPVPSHLPPPPPEAFPVDVNSPAAANGPQASTLRSHRGSMENSRRREAETGVSTSQPALEAALNSTARPATPQAGDAEVAGAQATPPAAETADKSM